MLLYQTMDNLDGKQAVRTKSSSPLGEMFDHGVDALVVVVCVLLVTPYHQGYPPCNGKCTVMMVIGPATLLLNPLVLSLSCNSWEL